MKIIYLILLINFYLIESSKLNVPRVLLPIFQKYNTNFTLEVSEGGCYKWTSTREDIVQLNMLEPNLKNGCSAKAVISATTRDPSRQTAIVIAQEVHSGQILRCDILVDVIDSLRIVTTTRELFVEEAPEAFEVRAYDNQGNEFTSLEGIEFSWNLHQKDSIIRFITFRDSPYETPHSITFFDTKGLKGHIALLEGVKTGAAKVSVSLPQPEYSSHVASIEVDLLVVANLILSPNDVHIMPGDTVQFRLLQVRHGKLIELSLPSKQYELKLITENDKLASLNTKTGLLLAQQNGKVKVTVSGVQPPSATVTISWPTEIKLVRLPDRRWFAALHENCQIVAEIFDGEGRRFHLGPNARVNIQAPNSFHVETRSTNGTSIEGSPLQIGHTTFQAELVATHISSTKVFSSKPPTLSTKEILQVSEPILVKPERIYLSADPNLNSVYDVKFQAFGGDGRYTWTSSDHAWAQISGGGSGSLQSVSVTATNMESIALITVAQSSHPLNVAQAEIHLVCVSRIKLLRSPKFETLVGTDLSIYLIAETESRVTISDCHLLSVAIRVECSTFTLLQNTTSLKQIDKDAPAEACAKFDLRALSSGICHIHVSLLGEERQPAAETTVAAFDPLVVLYPKNDFTTLALGTSRQLVFTGGPRPWLPPPGNHSRQLFAEDKGASENFNTDETILLAEEEELSLPGLYGYRVLCQHLGESKVIFRVGNALGSNVNQIEVAVNVLCAKPRTAILEPAMPINKGCPPPPSRDETTLRAACRIPYNLTITIRDAEGHVMDNITSLHIDWRGENVIQEKESTAVSTRTNYVKLFVPGGLLELIDEHPGGIVQPGGYIQTIYPTCGGQMKFLLLAKVTGYNASSLKIQRVSAEYPPFSVRDEEGYESTPLIQASVKFILFAPAEITPNKSTVILSKDVLDLTSLEVSNGSGYFKLRLSNTNIADVSIIPTGEKRVERSIKLKPKQDGLVQLALHDFCLPDPSTYAQAEIRVVSIKAIEVDMPDRVELGRTIVAHIRLIDAEGQTISPSSIIVAGIQVEIADGDIASSSPSSSNTATYVLLGESLGNTNVIFKSQGIVSSPQPLMVFPALRLHPRNITLLVGTSYQISYTGGPQPLGRVDLSLSNSDIVDVINNNLIKGLSPGQVTLSARALMPSGQRQATTQDFIEIRVVPLQEVKIHSPTLRLSVGSNTPIWAVGIGGGQELSPLILGTVQPSIFFSWRSNPGDILTIRDRISNSPSLPEDAISMIITANRPGKCIIYLNASVPTIIALSDSGRVHSGVVELRTSLELWVEPHLQWQRPTFNYEFHSIILGPGATTTLSTNLEGVSYHVDGKNIDVDSSGVVHASTIPGISKVTAVSNALSEGSHAVISLLVQIRPVAYISLSVQSSQLANPKGLPRGGHVSLQVVYHESSGMPLTAIAASDLRLETSRGDFARVRIGPENGTLLVELDQKGVTMLHVWDTHNRVEDYIKLRISPMIHPEKTSVTAGDIICFSSSEDEGTKGGWSSDQNSIIRVNEHSGLAQAVGIGHATIRKSLQGSSNQQTTAAVIVEPVQELTFQREKLRRPAVLTEIEHLELPVAVHPSSSNIHTCKGLKNLLESDIMIPFNCHASPEDHFEAKSYLNISAGWFSCILGVSATAAAANLNEANVTIRIEPSTSLTSTTNGDEIVIPFFSAIRPSLSEIPLGPDSDWQATFKVRGARSALAGLKVTSSDPTRLAVLPANEKYSYGVRLLNKKGSWLTPWTKTNQIDSELFPNKDELGVILHSSETGQIIKLPIKQISDSENQQAPCLVSQSTWTFPATSWVSFIDKSLLAILGSLILITFSFFYIYKRIIQATEDQTNLINALNVSTAASTRTRSPYSSFDSSYLNSSADLSPTMVYGDPRLYRRRQY